MQFCKATVRAHRKKSAVDLRPCRHPGKSTKFSTRVLNLVPVYFFICSFVFTCSFGRKSNVRSEQALRSEYVALECMHY